MAHEADGGLAVVVLGRGVADGLNDRAVVFIAREQRVAQHDGLELVGVVGLEGVEDVGVLVAGHEVGRLHDDLLHALFHELVHGLLEVVDDDAVALGELVDDNLRGEGAAHVVVGVGLADGVLDGADGDVARVVVARAEAHHKDDGLGGLGLVGLGDARLGGKPGTGGGEACGDGAATGKCGLEHVRVQFSRGVRARQGPPNVWLGVAFWQAPASGFTRRMRCAASRLRDGRSGGQGNLTAGACPHSYVPSPGISPGSPCNTQAQSPGVALDTVRHHDTPCDAAAPAHL